MGDVQSAQRDEHNDAAAEEEESGKVDDAPTIEQNIDDKSLKNKEQLSEIIGTADSSVTEVNGLCEEESSAEAILSPNEDVSETEKPLKEEETPLENVEMNEKDSPNEADAIEDIPLEMIEIDAKQKDINESFRRFFSNIGLKLTVNRGSGEIATDTPDETNKEEPNRPEDIEDTAKETTSTNTEQNTAQETYDNDSTTCPTLTDVTSEDMLENAEEKTTETKEEVESDNADAAMASPVGKDAQQDATPEEQPPSSSPSSPQEEEVVVSPIKRFFTTGFFSGLRKKKKLAEDETPDKELEDMEKKEAIETREQTVQGQQQDQEDISLGVEAAAMETEHKENVVKEEILPAAQMMDTSTIIVTESEIQEIQILSSQEMDKVQASPLKRLLSGSSLKKLSKKQRSRTSSDAKLSDSGEHASDQLLSSTESAENQKEEGSVQPSAKTAGEEDGAWASFKKLMTPKKRMKRSSLSDEGKQIPGSVEEPKPSEGGQISDHSTEDGKKRKDSSVSWDSVLCGSGRRRSRKTSDSEDESPKIDSDKNKQDGGSKHSAESAQEGSNEVDEILAYPPNQAGSPSEGDGGSTWKSLKRLVTPKRKVKDEEDNKDNVQSDSEVSQDESSFSIKKLLPGRKKRKSAEKQDQISSDEADKEAASGDEDSDTPAVVPLSEFDTVETEVHIQTQADIESCISKEADSKLQQDLLDQMAESVLPCDSLQTEAKKVQDNDDALENKESTAPGTNEQLDDSDTESISKQQLSDIPEEATPASVTEEAARDDTIAEDLVEITSEAITAPEPLDITLADETEMISALSQLSSESSKTSGNTTPVPAEYVVKETDALLHQVVENISISPKAVPAYSDGLNSERILVSGSHQILETEPTALEIDRRLDATDINTSLNVEELDAINELAATTHSESISEVNDSVSTEIVSEVPTEEFDTAEIAVDEVHGVDVAHAEESLKELESIDDHLVESLSEVNVAVSADEGSLVEAHQTETESSKMDIQDTDSSATVTDETKDGAMEQEVQSLTEKGDQLTHNITEQIQAEDKDQPSVEVEELQELAATQAATLDSEDGGVQLLEKDVLSEDIPTVETVTYELKEETVLQNVDNEQENNDELETLAAQAEHVQVPEAPGAAHTSTLDSEGNVQPLKEEVKSEDTPPAETVTDEPKQTAEHLTEVSVKPENKEPPANANKTVKDSEILESVQAPTLDSEEGIVQSSKEEIKSEDIPPVETVIDEPKQTTEHLTEVSVKPENNKLPVCAVKTVQEPDVLEPVQAPTLDSAECSVQSSREKVKFEDTPPAETVTDEPKEDAIPLTGDNLELVEGSKEPEVLEAVQAPTLDSAEGSVQSLEKEVISDDIPEAETVTDEPKEKTIPLTGANLEPMDASKTAHVQEPEVLEATQAPTLGSEEESVQSLEKEVISEDVPGGETVTDEPKDKLILVTEAKSGPVDASKTEHVPEPEVLKSVQAPTLDSAEGCVQSLEKEVISEDVPKAETVTDEPKEKTPLTGANIEPVDASKTEHSQEPEVLEAVQAATLDSEEESVQSLEKEVISDDIPEAETVADESKEKTTPLTGANTEPVDASKTEHSQEPEVLKSVQAPTLDSEEGSVQSLEKEVISENVPETETVMDKPKEEMTPPMKVKFEPVDASKTEHVPEPEVLKSVQAPTLDSAESSVQSLEKEVISENVPEAETVIDKPKEVMTPPPKVKFEPVDASKTEHVPEPEILVSVQAPTLDLAKGCVQSPKKEVISEDVPKADTVTDKPKEEIIPLTEANPEPVDASKTEHVQELEVLEAVQAATLDSEEGSVQSLEKEVISEDVPEAETVTDEPKEETKLPNKVNSESVDSSEAEHVQEPEVLHAGQSAALDSEVSSLLTLEQDIILEDIPAVEKVTDEPKQETEVDPEEKLPVEATETKHVQEPEVLQSDVQDNVTETKTEGTSIYVHVVTESIEGGNAQELAKQILLDDVLKPNVVEVIASVTDGLESEVVAQLDHSLEIAEHQKTESTPQGVEQEDHMPEIVEELQTLTAISVFNGETPAPCVDNTAVTEESKREVQLSAVQVSVEAEKESELPDTEIKTAAVEHAIVAQVVLCNLKDVSVAIPDVLIEETSSSTEPLIDRMASELEVKEEVETATPLVKDDMSETVKEGSVVMMMHVPSVKFEDNHGIQVQVVTEDIKSAETIVDTVLEVGITEAKEVIDVCHEILKTVDNLSASPKIEEELMNEENKVTFHEVTQHVKENVTETAPESMVVNLEKDGIKQPDAVAEVSEMVESQSNEVEDQKTMENGIATLRERQDEAPTVISDVPATEQQVSEDLMQTPDIPESLDVSIHDQKDDLEEAKAELEKPKAGVTVEEVKSHQTIHEGAQIMTPSDTESVAPVNTGIISSTGNVDSLSNLSIPQIGQANAPASPPPTTERFEPGKKTHVSAVRVQAAEEEPIKPTKQTELMEVTVQTTEPAQNLDSMERAVIMAQPVLMNINIQAMETVEPVEHINSTERVTSGFQATETIQPVRQTDKRQVFLSPPVLFEACDQETKAEEPVKQKEEDQDVWMDAEEDIYTQEKTEMSLLEVEESLEPQKESEPEEKAGLEHEVETAPNSKSEEKESQQEMYKTARTCDIDSEGEDFAVALEHPDTEIAVVTTTEWN